MIPGNILYKQRGTHWWPGENCIMGRDHTIHAMATGYVKYYRDPARHPDRKYIGVVFNKSDTLPYPQHAERKRRLNMTTLLAVRLFISLSIKSTMQWLVQYTRKPDALF